MRFAQLLEAGSGRQVASTWCKLRVLVSSTGDDGERERERVARPLLLAYQKVAYGASAKWPFTCTLPAAEVVHVISSLSHSLSLFASLFYLLTCGPP